MDVDIIDAHDVQSLAATNNATVQDGDIMEDDVLRPNFTAMSALEINVCGCARAQCACALPGHSLRRVALLGFDGVASRRAFRGDALHVSFAE